MEKREREEKEEERMKKWDDKYGFISFKHSAGIHKKWDFQFILLTKKEREKLMKQTYNRMKIYNRRIKPKEWAGYSDSEGEDI